ncbi:serine hydrolase domain-containing protein [Kineococcus sp. SYSU DK003]|uniref:serine hydrolase domain-containing protein n=1 Tax=Kineococcus sp. SYSU DK003 TaxID=3383124 RepID=UPI003D7DC3A7
MTELLESWVREGTVAGAVALVDRAGEQEVAAAGVADLATGRPVRRDTIVRYASITKPVTAAAAMTFVQDGALGLEDPVERWLPELRGVRVLREPGAGLDDTVPPERPITVTDVLTSCCGWGFPSTFEGAWVERLLTLQPGLEIDLMQPPDRWIADLAAVPLRHQPGQAFLYGTSYDLLGVLLSRVAGRPFPEVVSDRVLRPLGMRDAGFHVTDLDRFCAAYRSTGNGLEPTDSADGRWGAPPAFPSGAGGLVGTLDDWYAFARELLVPGRVLSPESVRLMTTNHLGQGQRREGELFLQAEGWGFGGSVHPDTGRYGWVGGSGTSAHVVPTTATVGILLTQTEFGSPVTPAFLEEFWSCAF